MAFSIAVNSDHTLTFGSNTLAYQNEAGVAVTVTLDAATTVLATGKLSYIDFLLPDGTPYFKGSYDGSGGSFIMTLGATDTILEQDGRIGIQFVIRDVAPPLSTEIWKSELKFAKIKSSANATSHALAPVIPPLTFPATFPAEDVSITDAGGYYAGTDVETALQEIGAGLLAFDKIAFDTTAAIEPAYGEIAWDDTDGTVAIGLKNSNVKLQVGQENVILATNKHGSDIANGEVIYVSGAIGDRVEIKKANANAFSTFSGTIGIATEPITNNQTGYIATYGLVRDMDTSAFAEGAQLFLGTTDGALTATKPDFPNGQVSIGWCVRSHATVGIIFVSIQHYKLDQAFHQKNIIMNGGFDVWQRGTSLGIPSTQVKYLADRWYDYHAPDGGVLPTITRSKESDIVNGFENISRISVNGTGSGFGALAEGNYNHRIEHGTRKYAGDGKKVTITFYGRCSFSKKIGISMYQTYGTGGSPTADEIIIGKTVTLTTTWTKYTHTFTLNTLSGKTFGTDNNDFLMIQFGIMYGSTVGSNRYNDNNTINYSGANTIDIANVCMTQGDIPMTYVAEKQSDVLMQCKRYYEKSCPYFYVPASAGDYANHGVHYKADSTSSIDCIGLQYTVEKRTVPTLKIFGGEGATFGYNYVRDDSSGGAKYLGTSPTFLGETTTGFVTILEGGSGAESLTPGSTYRLGWTADAEL